MGKASDNVFPKVITAMQTADPSAPGDSSWKVYAKAGGIYARSSNAVVGPFGTSGGGGGTPTFVGARVYRTATQNISHATVTAIQFNNERYDTDGFHDNVTNNTRLTVPSGKAGYYHITAMLQWDSNTSGSRIHSPRLNGSTILAEAEYTPNFTSVDAVGQVVSCTYYLSVGDYIEMTCYQTSGGTRTTRAAEEGCFLSMELLGT